MSTDEYRFPLPSQYVGRWRLGGPQGLSLHMQKRPRWLTRVLCSLLLEWEWIDGE